VVIEPGDPDFSVARHHPPHYVLARIMGPERSSERKKGTRLLVLSLGALCVQLLVVLLIAKVGPNLRLYRHFARLAAQGVDIFDPALGVRDGIDPRYLDFTPMNLAVYRLLLAGEHALGAFVVYQIGHLALACAAGYWLFVRGRIELRVYAALVVVLAFNPGLTVLLLRPADDKILYVSLPLAALAIMSRAPTGGFAALGIYGGWTGAGLLAGPLVWLRTVADAVARGGTWLRAVGSSLPALLAWGAGVVLTVAPYFPRNLILFENRLAREALPPFWYSLWHLVGREQFQPWMRTIVVLLAVGGLAHLALRRKLGPSAAVALSASLSMLVSNNTVHSRILTTAFLFIVALPSRKAWVYAGVVLVYSHLTLLVTRWGKGFLQSNTVDGYFVDSLEALLINSVLLIGVGMVLIDRSERVAAPPR
jgi:hypothetical protein